MMEKLLCFVLGILWGLLLALWWRLGQLVLME